MPARQRRLATIVRLFRLAAPAPPAIPSGPPATASAHPAGASGEPFVGYLTDLLATARDELNRADAKASLLLAAIGVITGALVGCFTSSNWTPRHLGAGEQALWWAGVTAAMAGVFLILTSVYPRVRHRMTPQPSLPAYYGDVAAFPDVDTFRRAISKPPDAIEQLLDQTYVVARIVQAKYLQLQRGLVSLLIAILACTLSIVLHVVLS